MQKDSLFRIILTISKKERRKTMRTREIPLVNIDFYYSATTKCTSMSLGNQKGWIDNLNNAPPKININS